MCLSTRHPEALTEVANPGFVIVRQRVLLLHIAVAFLQRRNKKVHVRYRRMSLTRR